MVVSVNEQLIGKKEFGASTPFGYCGNIVPLKINPKVIERVRKVSNVLGKEFGLMGSNGFDFVINQKNEVYLMEVNPRFQATLECIQFVTGLNLIGEHIKACRGELPRKVPIPNGYAVKVIVFAKENSLYPDLSGIKNTFDISRVGVTVDKGNPICTVQVVAEERGKAIRKAWGKVSEIYERIEL
jgi:predicted ATP-grasp superfamily ATP-dependent carboligase